MTRKAGRPGITEADVQSALNTLWSQGRPTTYEAIRDILGRGSRSTIQKHLNAILDRQDSAPDSVALLPPELSQSGSDLVQKIWATASQISQAEATSVRERALHKVSRLEVQIAELCGLLDAAERRVAAQGKELARRERTAARQDKACAKLEAQVQMLREQMKEWVSQHVNH